MYQLLCPPTTASFSDFYCPAAVLGLASTSRGITCSLLSELLDCEVWLLSIFLFHIISQIASAFILLTKLLKNGRLKDFN